MEGTPLGKAGMVDQVRNYSSQKEGQCGQRHGEPQRVLEERASHTTVGGTLVHSLGARGGMEGTHQG